MAWLTRLPFDGHYLTDILPALILMPFGMGITFMPLMAAATSGVPAHESGLASGMVNTSQQMGGALGLAILSGVAASVTQAATHLAPLQAVVHGYNRAFLTGLIFIGLALILAVTVIRQPKQVKEPAKLLQQEAAIH
jgi:MFS family permease